MVPSPGRIVLYTLSEYDADQINERRRDFGAHRRTQGYTDTGYVAHAGNEAHAGDIYPAVIIRAWDDPPTEATSVNLQVLLDGTDIYWATSRAQGPSLGEWRQPPGV